MNWNQVCNSGLLAAAIALGDERPELARLVINGAVQSLPIALRCYEPDGAYPEGPGYWNYGTTYQVLACAMLQNALGTDYGLSATPGLSHTTFYHLQILTPTGLCFNYADGAPPMELSPAYTWLAQHFGPSKAEAQARQLLEKQIGKKGEAENDRFLAFSYLWFPRANPGQVSPPPLDSHFRGNADLAIFRSAWDDPQAIYLGFKCGSNQTSHSHLDLGSFILEAQGVRWSLELGPDNYNLPKYFDAGRGGRRWTYLRMTNLAHSTVMPGSQIQDPHGEAAITGFVSTPEWAFAIADLTNAYPQSAKRLRRGVAILQRSQVLVQDEAEELVNKEPLVWRMVTGAEISLSDNGREAVLTQNGKRLHARLLVPAGAGFTMENLKPKTREENQNAGIHVLQLSVPSEASLTRIAILLTPEAKIEPDTSPGIVPLDEWR